MVGVDEWVENCIYHKSGVKGRQTKAYFLYYFAIHIVKDYINTSIILLNCKDRVFSSDACQLLAKYPDA